MITLTGSDLSIDEVVAVARRGEKVAPLDAPVRDRMSQSNEWIEATVARGDRAIYGVNTGFGPLATERVEPEEAGRLSRNLILNCCAGVGPPLAEDVVRAMMVVRANTLARLNVCDQMSTPRAQAALEEFRGAFGRPAQATLLYHYARLIELVYACERTIELLNWDGITDTDVRAKVIPGAGRGVGVVEAPRGTLIHHYETDERGILTKVNLIVATIGNVQIDCV